MPFYNECKIINCYNLGDINGSGNGYYKAVGGLFTSANTSMVCDVINSCSHGIINQNSTYQYSVSVFGTLFSDAEVIFNNCYYSRKIVEHDETITINEGTIEMSDDNVQEVLESLNTYVEEHKNDYEVPLLNWVIGDEGYPVLDLKY